MRADLRLVELGLAASRARAQAEIRSGSVTLAGKRLLRPSEDVPADATLELCEPSNPWVSRGGLKLLYALDHFALDVAGKTAIDLGASTGGFTEVLLARGAARVYAVDVGKDQLHAKLKGDARVVCREGVNARLIDRTVVRESVDIIVADVSFISLKLVLPPALALAGEGAQLAALIKPQFEAGRGAVKKGVVRDASIHARVCNDIAGFLHDQSWAVQGIVESPIIGPEGNREFLIAARR